MVAKKEKRDPVSHRTPSQNKVHYRKNKNSPKQKKDRAKRNAARALLMEEGAVKKGDGKQVDHKRPLKSGGGNTRSNLRVRSAHSNASAGAKAQKRKR